MKSIYNNVIDKTLVSECQFIIKNSIKANSMLFKIYDNQLSLRNSAKYDRENAIDDVYGLILSENACFRNKFDKRVCERVAYNFVISMESKFGLKHGQAHIHL